MLKKQITYSRLDGVEVTEDFYFNLTAAELTEKELIYPGGFANHLQRIVSENDKPEIIRAFKDLILWSYGIRGEDGYSFYKKGAAERFEATEAYSALFMELVTDTSKCVEFFNGVMPKDLAEKMKTHLDKTASPLGLSAATSEKNFPDDYSRDELVAMPQPEFAAHLAKLPENSIPHDLLMIAMQKVTK